MDLLLLFLPDLLGTFVGAVVGLSCAIWWDRTKQLEEKKELEFRTLESLLGEMKLIGDAAAAAVDETRTEVRLEEPQQNETDSETGTTVELGIIYLPGSAFDSAIHSGGLALLPAQLQVVLSGFYELVRLTRLHVDHMDTSYSKGLSVEDNVRFLENAQGYLRSHCEFILSQIQEIRPRLVREMDLLRERGQRADTASPDISSGPR